MAESYKYRGYKTESYVKEYVKIPWGEYTFLITGWTKSINKHGMLTYRIDLRCTDQDIYEKYGNVFYEIQLGTSKTDNLIGKMLDALGYDTIEEDIVNDEFFDQFIGQYMHCQVWYRSKMVNGNIKVYRNITPIPPPDEG